MFQSKYHTREEWELHRAEIRRLYIDEDNTLQHVMAALSQGGFTATTKMYKTKLKQWKLFKNNRAADIAAVLKSQSQRTAVGKESIAVRNGKRIDPQSYLKRKGMSAEDLLQLAAASATELPGYLRCVTPPAASSTPMEGILFGNSPGRLGMKEVIGRWVLRECERLGDGMSTGMVVDSGIECEMDDKERPLLLYYESAASRLAAEYYDAIWLLQRSQSAQAWTLINAVFSRLFTLLDDREHLLYPILNFLMIILILPPDMYQIHRALWNYLASYALIRFGSDHPVHQMLQQLTALFEQVGEPEDENCELLYSIITDALSALRGKMEEDGVDEECQGGHSRQIYYDLVALWYAESLRSHRGHRHSYHPQLHVGQEDLCFSIRDASDPYRDPDSDLELISIQSYLLLDQGHQTSWHDGSIFDSCAALLSVKQEAGAPSDETEVNCLTAMALYHYAQAHLEDTEVMVDVDVLMTRQEHHSLARSYLQQALGLDWDMSGASIYNFEGSLLLQEWYKEADDWVGFEVVRQRSETCLSILLREWGV